MRDWSPAVLTGRTWTPDLPVSQTCSCGLLCRIISWDLTPMGCLRKKKKKNLKGEEKAVTVLLVSETNRAFFPLPDCAQSRLFLYKEWQLWLYLWKHSYFQSTLLCLGSVQLPTEQEQFSYSGKTASTLWCDSEVVTVLWIHNLFECDLAFKCKEAPRHVKSQEKKKKIQRKLTKGYCADFAFL